MRWFILLSLVALGRADFRVKVPKPIDSWTYYVSCSDFEYKAPDQTRGSVLPLELQQSPVKKPGLAKREEDLLQLGTLGGLTCCNVDNVGQNKGEVTVKDCVRCSCFWSPPSPFFIDTILCFAMRLANTP